MFANPNSNFTLIVPDNETFKFEGKSLKALVDVTGVEIFENIMRNHIFEGVIIPDILNTSDNINITAVSSASFTILNKDFYGITMKIIQWYSDGIIKEAKIKTPQGIKANNGIVYVVDTILY